jgi:hypothetical protein
MQVRLWCSAFKARHHNQPWVENYARAWMMWQLLGIIDTIKRGSGTSSAAPG